VRGLEVTWHVASTSWMDIKEINLLVHRGNCLLISVLLAIVCAFTALTQDTTAHEIGKSASDGSAVLAARLWQEF
jgi:hypothetical protein